MASWNEGYVTDIQYTSGFYRELAPSLLSYIALSMGQYSPSLEKPFTYCELGCGQGYGTNILAASNPNGRFWGFDFNPAQIANARRLAQNGGLENVTFGENSFAELAGGEGDDLPEFDFISLHGIYSWISEENRLAIVSFIKKKLKAGGLVYVSYNSLPGWSTAAPLRRLLSDHAKAHPARSDVQVMAAIKFAEELRDSGARYFTTNPAVGEKLTGINKQNRQYVAHEYLNDAWNPMYHADVVKEFDLAKLNFLASASLIENMNSLSVPEKMRPLVESITDPVMAQTAKDFAVNRQFRRDIFVRGASQYASFEQAAELIKSRFIRTRIFSDGPLKFKTPLGEANASGEIYQPLLNLIKKEAGVTIGEAQREPGISGQTLPTLLQAFSVMAGDNYIHPALPVVTRQAEEYAQRFNRAVIQRVLAGADLSYLAAPQIGSGLGFTAVDMFAIDILMGAGSMNAQTLTDQIWRRMKSSGRRVNKDGQTVTEDVENIRIISKSAEDILAVKVPFWRGLGILPRGATGE